jgi:ferrochelatase
MGEVDSVLLLSFGGPEAPEDVMPFLERVTVGRSVPRARLLEVARRYEEVGGRSPINDLNRGLAARLATELAGRHIDLPVYLGNRNWHPFLEDTLRTMGAAGHRRVLAFVTSAFASYSGCRQYLEDIERARSAMGPDAPVVEKLRVFFDHPLFIDAVVAQLAAARACVGSGDARVVYTAHSIPTAMAAQCDYVRQLEAACGWVSARLGISSHDLVYQSRSGPPMVPWLEPDVLDHVRRLASEGVKHLALCPVGFVADHMEVVWDLDREAAELCRGLGVRMERAATVLGHPAFITMIRELIEERTRGVPARSMGCGGPLPPECPPLCCASGRPGGASQLRR